MTTSLSAFLLLVPLGLPVAPRQKDAAEEQYRFLAALVEKGLNEEAVGEARAFLRDFPRHARAPLARYRLAGALWELGRRDEAAREYDALARDDAFEYRAEALFRSGEAALARGDAARARAAFEGVLAAGQAYLVAPALHALGEALARSNEPEEAERRFEQLLREHPDAAEAPLARRALAWTAWERGDAAETVRRARAFLDVERDPARADEMRVLLGEALLTSDPSAALATFRALRTSEQAAARLRGEGFALAALGDHGAAARAFETLLEREPDGPHAREAALQAGIERLRAGEPAVAVERLRAAARAGDPETLYWLAQAQHQGGDERAALATLDQALRARPARELEARILVLSGDCLAASGRTEEALAAYERSGSAEALHAGAVAALARGDADEAARLARRLLEAQPDGPRAQPARVVLGEALFAAGRHADAEREFERAAATPADAAEAARLASRLAWCRYLSGDRAGARARFSALAERSPKSPEGEEALALLVRIAEEEGDAAAARASASRYLETHPRGRFGDQALLVLARGAEGDEARRLYARWLERHADSPLRPAVLLEVADRESAEGRHDAAARLYAEVRALAPDSPEGARAGYGLAWSAWEQRDLAVCRAELARLVEPRSSADAALRQAALELLLWVEVDRGALEDALAAWRALEPRGEERRLQGARRLARALRDARRFDDADALLDETARSLTTRTLQAEAQIERAYVALERGDPAAAEAALARARKGGAPDAELAEASFHVGEARLAAGDAERALALYQGAAASESPRAADALYKLGFVRLGRGELAQAAEALTALLERHPGSALEPEARFLLGECAFRGGDHEAAVPLLDAVRRAPGASAELRAKALFRLGLALGELERWSEAEGALAELARTAPEFPNLAEAELWRGRALAAQRKARPARAAFERTLALDQGELAAGARLGLGRLAESEGRLDEALSEYLKVALLYAHEESVSEALFAAGRVLESQGQPDKAAARYRELAEQHPRSSFATDARERLRDLEAGRR